MWQRHADMHKMLWEGLTELGLKPFVKDPEQRLVTVNTITVRPYVVWCRLGAVTWQAAGTLCSCVCSAAHVLRSLCPSYCVRSVTLTCSHPAYSLVLETCWCHS
jgi:hypothetical protein